MSPGASRHPVVSGILFRIHYGPGAPIYAPGPRTEPPDQETAATSVSFSTFLTKVSASSSDVAAGAPEMLNVALTPSPDQV